MDLRFEHETFRVHQQVALTALDLLSTVVSALFPAHSGGLYRLAIDYASAGLRISLEANP
jgi:hypothetical protein